MSRVVNGIGGAVVGMSGGDYHSLVFTAEGHVLAFGGKGPFATCGGLGLGVGVAEALTPTAIDGITMRADAKQVELLGRLIEGSETKKEEAAARHAAEVEETAARHAAEVEEAAARYAEELRRIEEDKERQTATKAALEKQIADKATEAAEGKE